MGWSDEDIAPYAKLMHACLKLTGALSDVDQESPDIKHLRNLVEAPFDEQKLATRLTEYGSKWSNLTNEITTYFSAIAKHLESLYADILQERKDVPKEDRKDVPREYWHYWRIGRRFAGHDHEFWSSKPKKKDNLTNKECVECLSLIFDLLPGKNESGSSLKVVKVVLEPIIRGHWAATHTVPLSDEESAGLINRLLSGHKDPAAVQFLSLKETIEGQLNLIEWKDYVPASGSWMKLKKPALDHLKEWRMGQEGVLQVTGDGGLGKTKLIYEFLKACLGQNGDTESFDSYIFLTAKSESQGEFNVDYRSRTDYNVLVTNPRDPTVAVGQYIPNLSFDQCIEYYKAAFGVNDKEDLRDCFKNQKVLVILDNFEDVKVPDIEKHLRFIKHELDVSMESKFLITGRADADDAKDYGIGALKLGKLTRDEASQLVRKRYRYLFEKQYATSSLKVPPKMDLREAFENLTKRNELIETIGQEIVEDKTVRAFKLGQHHPMVLFWVISLLMDRKIFEEAENLLLDDAGEGAEAKIKEKNAVTMFKFVVEHDQYGLQNFIDNWEEWIREKSTVYLENDKTCMLIIDFLAKKRTELVDDVEIFTFLNDEHDIEEEAAQRALNKILVQPDVLEQDTDYPKYRITKKALANFDLDLDENTDPVSKRFSDHANEFIRIQSDSKQMDEKRVHAFLEDIKNLNPSAIESKRQAVVLFKTITFSMNIVAKTGNFPLYANELKDQIILQWTNVKNLFIPNLGKKEGSYLWWTIEDMVQFTRHFTREDYPPDISQKDALDSALEIVNNPLQYPALRDDKASKYYIGNLPDAFSHLLWILPTREELLQYLEKDGRFLLYFGKSETTPFLENIIPNVGQLLKPDEQDFATKEELVTLFPLFFRCTKYLEQLHSTNLNIVKWYIRSILRLPDMGAVEDLLGEIEQSYFTFQPSHDAIISSFRQALGNRAIRNELTVNQISVGLYNYFGCLEPHTPKSPSQPFDTLPKDPFTRWNNEFGLPHEFYPEGTAYNGEEGETIPPDIAKRDAVFILSNFIHSLDRYEFLQLPLLREKPTLDLGQKAAAVQIQNLRDKVSNVDAQIERISGKSKPLRENRDAYDAERDSTEDILSGEEPHAGDSHSLDIPNNQDIMQNLIEHFDNLEFTRVYLRDVMKDNNINEALEPEFWREVFKNTEKDWKILYSAHDKGTIVSFDSFVPKTVHPTKSPSYSYKPSPKKDRYLEWFERPKHGMHHDQDKAIAIIGPLIEKLGSKPLDLSKPPVVFANAFVKTFVQDPYAARNRLATSMRWYAAFHYRMNEGHRKSVCDIINWYAGELSRQLPNSELSRDQTNVWEENNLKWINALKDHFGCENKMPQNKKNHKQRRKERRAKEEEFQLAKRKKQRKEAAERAAKQAAELKEAAERAAKKAAELKKARLDKDMKHINLHMGTILEAIEAHLISDEKTELKKHPGIAAIYWQLFDVTGNLEGTWFMFITDCSRRLKGMTRGIKDKPTDRALNCVRDVLSRLGASETQITEWETKW